MSQGVRGNNGALNNHTDPRLWWGVMKNLNREVEKVRKATWHIKSFNSIRGRRFCLRFFFCLEKKDKRLQGGFIMQRHSGRDWVGVLRHTEEQECVATGRDRQNSSAECGKKKGEVKKRNPHSLPTCSFTIRAFLDHPWTKSEKSSLHSFSCQKTGQACWPLHIFECQQVVNSRRTFAI